MTTEATAPQLAGAPGRLPVSPLLVFFLLLPVVAHVVGLIVSFVDQDYPYISFEQLDLWFLLGLVVYLAAALFAATSRAVALRFALVVYASLLALGLAEGVARWLLPVSPEGLPQAPKRFTDTVGPDIPGLSGVTYTYSVNSQGLRGPEVDLDAQDHRILCIGGSTTECVLVDDAKTWPARLQARLSERLRKAVYVGNAGVSGHFTKHHAYQIKHYENIPRFEWIVVMAGINDMGRAEGQPNYVSEEEKVTQEALTPVFKYRFYYRRLGLVRLSGRVLLYWGSDRTVVADSTADWVRKRREQRQEAIAAGRVNQPAELEASELQAYCKEYRKNLLAIIQAAREREVNVLLLTQPTLYARDLSPDMQRLVFAVSDDGVAPSLAYQEKIIKAYNRTMVQLCKEEGIDCIDLDRLLPRDTTVYFDDCHFNHTGCDRIAGILANFFARKLGKP